MGYSPAQKGAIDLAKRSLVDSIYTSCKVEGLSTTFPDTQNILDYPINLMYIRELNKICGNRLIYGSGEVIRKLNELNTMTDPIERAVKTFCYLAKAQLFIDGNKRLAQLTRYLSLKVSEYSRLTMLIGLRTSSRSVS